MDPISTIMATNPCAEILRSRLNNKRIIGNTKEIRGFREFPVGAIEEC